MNKDFDMKHDPRFDSGKLRRRITDSIKQQRDETEELDVPQAKTMPIIPVTGGLSHKYFNNKSPKEF